MLVQKDILGSNIMKLDLPNYYSNYVLYCAAPYLLSKRKQTTSSLWYSVLIPAAINYFLIVHMRVRSVC